MTTRTKPASHQASKHAIWSTASRIRHTHALDACDGKAADTRSCGSGVWTNHSGSSQPERLLEEPLPGRPQISQCVAWLISGAHIPVVLGYYLIVGGAHWHTSPQLCSFITQPDMTLDLPSSLAPVPAALLHFWLDGCAWCHGARCRPQYLS